jgi:hypothetical protein
VSSLASVRGSHLKLIAGHSARHGIRGGTGLVFCFFTLLVGLGVAGWFVDSVGNLQKALKQRGEEVSAKEIVQEISDRWGADVIGWFTTSQEQIDYLTKEKPTLLAAVVMILMYLWPLLIALGAFNQFSGDVGNKGVRYLLLRTERPNLFFGRFVGTYLFTVFVLLLLVVLITLVMIFATDYYPKGDVILFMAQSFFAMAIMALPYVAFCSWISANVDSAFGSMAVSALVVGLFPVFVYFATKAWAPARWAGYVFPWPLRYELLHPNLGHVAGATAAMLGYTALYLFLGGRSFTKRDL